MARTEGATNKNKPIDNEGLFLNEALRNYNFWKSEAAKLEEAGKPSVKEREYADAYRVLLNRFTIDDK